MDIKKFLPSKKTNDDGEYYWAILIEPSWVHAGIWKISQNKAQVVYEGSVTAWELDEELVGSVDTALSSAIQNFPEDAKEPSKTVFGVISSWVSGGEIKSEYLGKIKKICSELSLTPVGFVVLPEAIAHLIKSEEGSPLSAVVLGVYKQNLEVSVFRLGSLVGTTTVARSVNVIDDVTEGLSRFAGSEPIPSRFLVYDGKEGEIDEVEQLLLKANWQDFPTLKFLHTPKIESIDSKRKVQAVCLAGASELADVTILDKQKDQEAEQDLDEESKQNAQMLGFTLEKDSEGGKEESFEESEHDLDQKEIKKSIDNVRPVESLGRKKTFLNLGGAFGFINKMKGGFSKLFEKINIFKGSAIVGKKVFIFGFLFLVLVLAAGFSWWWYYPKVVVTIYVSPKPLKESISVSVNPDAENSNFDERVLKGELLTTEVEGEKTTQTTGTKTVGEKAKGEVTIYRVGSQITLDSGSVLNGPDDLKFALDEQTVVASGSASSPGSTNAKVTATDIGSQYNFASGTSFTIENYSTSDMEAKNENSFSGGSSREITVVSESDREGLEEDLKDELETQALTDVKEGMNQDKFYIDESLDATVASKEFSAKVGDEASSLKLSLSVEASVLSIGKDELTQFSQEILKDKIPEGFILRDDQIKQDFKFEEKQDDIYRFEDNIETNLLPNIDVEQIAKSIRGRHPSLAQDYFTRDVPGFVRAEIRMKPKLPGKLNTLPRVLKNIDIEISAER